MDLSDQPSVLSEQKQININTCHPSTALRAGRGGHPVGYSPVRTNRSDMPPTSDPTPDGIRDVIVETYAINDAMNQLILSRLDRRAWRVPPPFHKEKSRKGNGRTIAAIFAHLHNSRLVWIKHSAPHLKCPAALDPFRCTMKQAAAAHKKSAAQCLRMLQDALKGGPKRRVKKFSRGAWTRDWSAGATMFAYMFSHEAHHRGQILMLAHQLGHRLPVDVWAGIWWWEKLWKQVGFTTRPR